ncbi:MAG: hypothetical protein EBR34_16265 [Sphingomonadaceae bacterium]|nr:hypothetical protein [Sphingomonadaceae bacterium]
MVQSVNTTLPQSGINFANVYPVATTASTATSSSLENPSPPWLVGTVELGSSGTEWIFCIAGGTVAAGDFVIITTATFTATAVTSTLARAALGGMCGIAGGAATVGQFLWVCRKGYITGANVATSASAFTALHTTATAGRLDSGSSANTTATISPVVGLATAASNTANVVMSGSIYVSALD